MSDDPIQNVRVVSETREGSASATYEDGAPGLATLRAPCALCDGSGFNIETDAGQVVCSECDGAGDWQISVPYERVLVPAATQPAPRVYTSLEDIRRDFGAESDSYHSYLQAMGLFDPAAPTMGQQLRRIQQMIQQIMEGSVVPVEDPPYPAVFSWDDITSNRFVPVAVLPVEAYDTEYRWQTVRDDEIARELARSEQTSALVSGITSTRVRGWLDEHPNCRCLPIQVHDEVLEHTPECLEATAASAAWSNPDHARASTDWTRAADLLARDLRVWARENEPGNENFTTRHASVRASDALVGVMRNLRSVVSRANPDSAPGRPNSRDRRRWRRKVREAISVARDLALEGRRGDVLSAVAEVVSPLELAVRLTDLERLRRASLGWGDSLLRQASMPANFGAPAMLHGS